MRKQTVGAMKGPFRIDLAEAPVPAAAGGGALVRVACTGICGTDLAFYREGNLASGTVAGHEFAGVVVAVGQGVTGLAPGQRVVANPMCDGVGLGAVPGSFAQYLALPTAELGRTVFALPDEISDEIGALVEPFAVAHHAIGRAAARPGEKVAIYGAGPIGLCILAGLRAQGLSGIAVIDPSPLRRDLALRMGADAVHDPRSGSAVAFLCRQFGAKALRYAREPVAQADLVFDCAGVSGVLDDGLHSLAQGGRLCLVADPHHAVMDHARLIMLHEIDLRGCLAYSSVEFAEAIDLLAGGKVDLTPLITHRFPLSAISEAFATQMDAERAVKVLIRP